MEQDTGPEKWPSDCKYQPCGPLLGKGNFGVVYPMRRQADGKDFAVKLIRRGTPACSAKGAERELQSWARLFHPHIVQFKECFLTPLYLCLVLEWVRGKDLHQFVNERRGLPEKQARWFFQQLMFAIAYSHTEGIIHRDIKLENTLLDQARSAEYPYVKLTDFGYSKCITQSLCHTRGVGTSAYMAPEVLNANGAIYSGEKVDVWSAGVMLYAMLYCHYPFGTPNDDKTGCNTTGEMARRILEVDLRIPEKAPRNTGHVSELCTSFIRQLLEGDPRRRLSVDEVISHPWFRIGLPPGAATMNDRCRDAPRKKPQSPEEITWIVQQAAAYGSH